MPHRHVNSKVIDYPDSEAASRGHAAEPTSDPNCLQDRVVGTRKCIVAAPDANESVVRYCPRKLASTVRNSGRTVASEPLFRVIGRPREVLPELRR
jgi:hypothetical protein